METWTETVVRPALADDVVIFCSQCGADLSHPRKLELTGGTLSPCDVEECTVGSKERNSK